jgi:hypothetical protein
MPGSGASSDFSMQGARVIAAEWLPHLEGQVQALERAVAENPGLAFDLAKTVVESVCRAILDERSVSFDERDDLPHLFRVVTKQLPMLPAEASSASEARRSLAQILGGLHASLQGVCELRNAHGFASHGTSGARPTMESTQALLAAQTADAIVAFLHRAHRQDRTPASAVLSFDRNQDFNSYVDEANDAVRIFDLEYRPSEVLFNVDQEAYRDLLANYAPDDGASDDEPPAEIAATA